MKRCVTKRALLGKQTNYKVCDIHAHVVPGIDDGATSFDMSMSLIRMAHRQGVKNIVCTSHDRYNVKQYFKNLKILQNKIDKENLGIRLYSGCEVYCTSDDMDNIIACLNKKVIPTINNTEYVLVEFSPYVYISEMVYCLKYLLDHGYIPIIAHVERYVALHGTTQWINLLHKMGCFFQVNAYSLVDENNRGIKELARTLLKGKYISFVGSDAHRTNHRPYAIKNGIDYIYSNCDEKYAKDICYHNAKHMLNMK